MEDQKFAEIDFYWKDKSGFSSCRLHDRSEEEAKAVAKTFGWKEPKWYNPMSWGNWMILHPYSK